ncbi:hypothetical protein HOH87_01785 [bacterium]|jgi:hypothetical protein|nr:hypothetical protein [bacterium]
MESYSFKTGGSTRSTNWASQKPRVSSPQHQEPSNQPNWKEAKRPTNILGRNGKLSIDTNFEINSDQTKLYGNSQVGIRRAYSNQGLAYDNETDGRLLRRDMNKHPYGMSPLVNSGNALGRPPLPSTAQQDDDALDIEVAEYNSTVTRRVGSPQEAYVNRGVQPKPVDTLARLVAGMVVDTAAGNVSASNIPKGPSSDSLDEFMS